MLTGKTPSGYEYHIDEALIKDWRYIKALRKIKSGTPEEKLDGMTEFVEVIFNDRDAEEHYYQTLAQQHGGRVPVDVLFAEIGEILDALTEKDGAVKN